MKRLFASLCLIAALATVVPVHAQITAVPNAMNFQGRLAKPDGTPLPNGTYSVRFSLWNALTGGTEVWNQTRNVTVTNGTFAATLSNFPVGTFNGNLWLEIKIGSNPALAPRQALASVAYALKADSVKDGAITTGSLADKSVTSAKIASVDWAKIVGAPGTVLTLPYAGSGNTDALTPPFLAEQYGGRSSPVQSGNYRRSHSRLEFRYRHPRREHPCDRCSRLFQCR